MKKRFILGIAAALLSTTALATPLASNNQFIIDNETGESLSYIAPPKSANFPKHALPSTKDKAPLVVNVTTVNGTDWMKIKDARNGSCIIVFNTNTTGIEDKISTTEMGDLRCSANDTILTITH